METKDMYELTIKRLYTKPQRLSQKDLENAKGKVDESLIIKSHYETCLRLAKYARENELNKPDFEDLLSDAYIQVYEFVTNQNKFDSKNDFLNSIEHYVINHIELSNKAKKEKNIDLNYKNKVGMNVLETKVPNFSVLNENGIALKMDKQSDCCNKSSHCHTK